MDYKREAILQKEDCMSEFVDLDLLVEKSVADEISRKGLAEIALRRSDAKFRAMIKCKVLGTTSGEHVIPETLIDNALNSGILPQTNITQIRGVLRHLSSISNSTKTMAIQVDGIYQSFNVVKEISYLNTGLMLANLVMNSLSYAIVGQELKSLNKEVINIYDKLEHVASVQKNDKISECQILIMKSNTLLTKIEYDEPFNLDDLETVLIEMCAFISKMIRNFYDKALDKDILLEMIYSLLPTYSLLLNEFVKRYYFIRHRQPANYKVFMDLFDMLISSEFREIKEDYYFLNKKKNSVDVLDILNAQDLLAINDSISIDDQLKMLGILGSETEYGEFEKGLEFFARSRIKEIIPKLASQSEMDEEKCAQLLID